MVGAVKVRARRISRPIRRTELVRRMLLFPVRPMRWAPMETRVEPHDIWHGMWAGSLPAIEPSRATPRWPDRIRRARRFLRSRVFDAMPRWQRSVMTRFERHWAHAADAVITVSEPDDAADDAARPGPR